MKVTYDIPMSLPSCANLREHWRARAKRARDHRMIGRQYSFPLFDGQKATITLTRIAPRKLDSDNVASAFKALRDGIADTLGVDDGSDRLEWKYAQAAGRATVRVEIEVR